MNAVLRPESPIRTFSRQYRNRLAIPLDEDFFLDGMRHFLEENKVFFARVPIKRTKEIYYFFNNLDDVRKFLAEQERFKGSATV